MSELTPQQLRTTVYGYYNTHGRHALPWRRRITPYRITISELMLQQTQVPRVEQKFTAFMRTYPSWKALAHADTQTLLGLWQGLGYNRRALYARAIARKVRTDWSGQLPRDIDTLRTFPGIGPYTAAAIAVFAWQQPVPLIETNIRTVYMHHLYPQETQVSDAVLLDAISETMDTTYPREWFWALMDYGSYLKQQGIRLTNTNPAYTKQKAFRGSDRQLRGQILALLVSNESVTYDTLYAQLTFKASRIDAQVNALQKEGFLRIQARHIIIQT